MVTAVPVTRTDARLGALARPARGRAPVPRFMYAVGYAEQAERIRPHLAKLLDVSAGPTRCDVIGVGVHSGPAIGDTLSTLADHGQSTEVLLRLAEAADRLALARPEGTVVLIVAATRALWAQPATAVGLS